LLRNRFKEYFNKNFEIFKWVSQGDRLLMTTYRETGMGEAKNRADQNFFAVELSPLVFLYDLR